MGSTIEIVLVTLIGLAIVGTVLFKLYQRSQVAQATGTPTPLIPQVVAAPDPVELLFAAMSMLETQGKKRGLGEVAGQFMDVHSAAHKGFIQAAIGPPTTPATVPNGPAAPAANP